MPLNITDRNIAVEGGCAARGTQRRERHGVGARSGGEKLVLREAVYELVCEEKNDTIVREPKVAGWRRGQKCGNGGVESCLVQNARRHGCYRKG